MKFPTIAILATLITVIPVAEASAIALLLPAVQSARQAAVQNDSQLPAIQKFAAPGGVHDTCDQTLPGWCEMDELVRKCDEAGGGMSTEPGGGVTCEMY